MAELLLVSNRSETVRRETLAGREYLVAPVVAIRAGILNGELVPLEEIAAYVEAWNGIPLPLGHPTVRGVPISANTPELEATLSVGRFWNAEMIDDRLRGEAWVDIGKAQAMGGDALEVLKRLENDEGIEVSTAYFRDLEPTPGQINGQRYTGIQHNLRPDHLALLLHEIGACSWKDGCGVPRINTNTSTLQLNQTGQHTGVMVALYPPESAAASLVVTSEQLPEGATPVPVIEIHLTMAYLGDLEKNEVGIDQGEMLRRVMEWSRNMPVIQGTISGVGRFTVTNQEGTQALFALFNCEYLPALRLWLEDWLPVKREKGFIPHLTLAYLPAAAATPNILPEPREIVFDRIGVAWGGQVTLFALQGEAGPATQEEALTGHSQHNGFNPFTLARSALRSLANALGFPKNEGRETDPIAKAALNLAAHTEEVKSMDRAKLIEKLVANKACPFDKADLEAMSEAALGKLEHKLDEGCGASEAPAANAAVETPSANAAGAAEQPVIPQELQELSAALRELGGVEGLKGALATVQANVGQRKSELVEALKANERCAFTEADLQSLRVEQLEKLDASLRPANYAGRGGPRGNAGKEEHQVPEPPKVIMGDAA